MNMTFLDVDPEDATRIADNFPDASVYNKPLKEQELVAACADAKVVCCFITSHFTREVLDQLPNLKLICTRSVGYDHIDMPACAEKGIMICNVPDYGSHVIAEHVFALLLSTLRHVGEGAKRVREGTFDYHGLRGMALQGKTIGIVGTGKIGRKAAKIAHGFGMRILAVDVCRIVELTEEFGVEYVELDQLLAESDIISLHVPSLPDTEDMINEKTVSIMKKGTILVNTARGTLIDTPALLQGLDNGTIRYALLDVLEHEANIKADRRLVDHKNVVTTPHVAFYADDSVRNMYEDSFTSINEWKNDTKPTRIVEPVRIVCDVPGVKK